MVSDFIDEHNGYLQLTDEEYASAKEKDPTIRKHSNTVRQVKDTGHRKDSWFN